VKNSVRNWIRVFLMHFHQDMSLLVHTHHGQQGSALSKGSAFLIMEDDIMVFIMAILC